MTLAIKEKAQRQGRKPAREPSGTIFIVDQRKKEPFGSDVTISAGISITPNPKKYPWANPTMKINFVNVRRGKQEIMAGSMIKFHPDFQEEAKKVHRKTNANEQLDSALRKQVLHFVDDPASQEPIERSRVLKSVDTKSDTTTSNDIICIPVGETPAPLVMYVMKTFEAGKPTFIRIAIGENTGENRNEAIERALSRMGNYACRSDNVRHSSKNRR